MATKHQNHEANPFEILGEGVGQAFKKDVGVESGKEFLRQLLGLELTTSEKPSGQEPKAKGSISKGEIVFNKEDHKTTKKELSKKPAKPESRNKPAIEYSFKTEPNSEKEVRKMQERIQQISDEIHKLMKSSNALQGKFRDVGVEQRPIEAGVYHEAFFEWLLITIRNARQNVEDANSWMNTGKSKNGKKTSFGIDNGKMHQSGERTTIQNSAG